MSSRRALMAGTALAMLFAGNAPALADCAPDPAADGATVTCSGADTDGFMSGSDDLTINILDGATVQGQTEDLSFDSAISLSGTGGVIVNNGTLRNDGTGASAIFTFIDTVTSVTNNGDIITNAGSGVQIGGGTFRNTVDGVVDVTGDLDYGVGVSNGGMLVNEGRVTVASEGAEGLRGVEGATIVNAETGVVLTMGDNVSGIASIFATESDPTSVTNAGSITTTGRRSFGIESRFSSNEEVGVITNTATGTITTRGDNAAGIFNSANDQVSNAGEIRTEGERAYGILSFSRTTIDNTNLISTTGALAAGVTLGSGNMLNNSGRVETSGAGSGLLGFVGGEIGISGEGASGVFVQGSDNVVNNASTGVIMATGATSSGITIGGDSDPNPTFGDPSFSGNTINNGGTIQGAVHGIHLNPDIDAGSLGLSNPTVTVNNAAGATISGTSGDGIRAAAIDSGTIFPSPIPGAGSGIITNEGTITAARFGILLGGGGTVTNAAGGQITSGSDGIRVLDDATILNAGTIATVGLVGGVGISATGAEFEIDVTDTGTITTSGAAADGIRVSYTDGGGAGGGDIRMDGAIVTTGDSADGIEVGYGGGSGNAGKIAVGGTIDVSGDDASGVYVFLGNGTTADIDVTAGGDISATGPEGYGIYLRSSGTGSATATVDIAANARVFAADDTTIAEGNAGGGLEIGTDLTVAGEVARPLESDIAIDLSTGADRLELQPGFAIAGLVDGGSGQDAFVLGGTGAASLDIGSVSGDGDDTGRETGEKYARFNTFAKQGASSWTLTGANDEIVFFALEAGTLTVNAQMPNTGFVAYNPGARFGGTGTIQYLEMLDGTTLAPGNSIGTLNIATNLSLAAGSTYEVEIASDGRTSDLVRVGGEARLFGGTLSVLTIGNPATFPDAGRYTIITANQVTGTFADVTDNLPDVEVMAEYNPQDVQIFYAGAVQPPEPPEPPVEPDPDGPEGPEEPEEPFVSPKELYPNALQANVLTGRLVAESLRRRVLLGGRAVGLAPATTAGSGNFGYPVPGRFGYPASGIAGQGLYGADFGPAFVPVAAVAGPGYGIWGMGLGAGVDADGDGDIPGFDADTYGLAFGTEGSADFAGGIGTLGLGGAWTRTDIEVADSAAETDAWHIGLYAGLDRGPLDLGAAVTYAWTETDFARDVPFLNGGGVTADAEADGEILAASLSASYDIAERLGLGGPNGLIVAPLATFDVVHAEQDGFEEDGAGILGLTVNETDATVAWSGLGVSLGTRYELASGTVIAPEVELLWEHRFGDDQTVVTSGIPLANAGFTTLGTALDDDLFRVGAGVGVAFSESFSAHARYDGSFADDFDSHRASAGVTFRF